MDAPWGATPDGARTLVLSVAEGTRPAGASAVQRVNDTQLARWIDEAAAEIGLGIRGYTRLGGNPDATPADPGQPELLEQIAVRARSLAELYAASLLEDVTHPERAKAGDTRYAAVLLNRYTTGLAALTSDVRAELTALDLQEPAAETDVEAQNLGPAVVASTPFLRDANNRRMGF